MELQSVIFSNDKVYYLNPDSSIISIVYIDLIKSLEKDIALSNLFDTLGRH